MQPILHGKLRSLITLTIVVAIVLFLALLDVQTRYLSRIYKLEEASRAPVAIVLGASVKLDGTPSDALRDRVITAVELYKRGRVQRLLMSGDDGLFHIDEVSVMRREAILAGIPGEDIDIDPHGYRTYESCLRARNVLGITKAIVVTQRFHLPRALYLCRELGIDAIGVMADKQVYQRIIFFTLRDFGASILAWMNIKIVVPEPPVSY